MKYSQWLKGYADNKEKLKKAPKKIRPELFVIDQIDDNGNIVRKEIKVFRREQNE